MALEYKAQIRQFTPLVLDEFIFVNEKFFWYGLDFWKWFKGF